MRRIVAAILLFSWMGLTQFAAANTPQASNPNAPADTNQSTTITLPTGTKVALALTSPLWAKSVKVGDNVYLMTSFPVAVGNDMAIPPGTYVEGKIDALTKPRFLSNHAQFQMHFTKLVFVNGYTVPLPDVLESAANAGSLAAASVPAARSGAAAGPNASVEVEAAVANVYVEVSAKSDVLLDTGAPVEMLLQTPLLLESSAVADAVSRSKPLQISSSKPSTLCRPTPGTPGTPDTVIPGTPGTPPTVIPGGPGMPPTVIPGTPGTSPTVIPGSPGFAGTACPGPPIVASVPAGKDGHTRDVTLTSAMQLAGVTLVPGKYEVRWSGMGPTAEVEILSSKKLIVRAPARVVLLGQRPAEDSITPRASVDGSVSLASLQFGGEAFAVVFD
jgi:hypothetical protein